MKKSVVVLGIHCVILAGICVWQGRELTLSRREVTGLKIALEQERRARAEQTSASEYLERRERDWKEKAMQLSALVGTLRASQRGAASNVAQVTQAAEPAAAGQTNEPAAGVFGKGMSAMFSKMLKDPHMKEMIRAQQKVAVKKMYGPLIADLKLPPEQQQNLTDLLLDQQMQTIERSQDMFKEDGADLAKIGEMANDTAKANDAAIKEVLGAEKFQEFEDYKKTMTERMELSEFKEQLNETAHPLRDDQSKQMMAVLKEERERYPPAFDANAGGGKNLAGLFEDGRMEKQIEWQEEVNRRVQERLASLLTAEQLKAYVERQEQQLSMQKFGIKMAREMFGKGAAGASGAP